MEITGKYCKNIKIFTDNIEDEALQTIYNLANHPVFENKKIRIMPDVHQGKGIVIGFTCPLTEAVSPAHVGCDIGCSMTTLVLSKCINPDNYALFEHRVKKEIPLGFNINEKSLSKDYEKKFYNHLNTEYNKARSAWPEMIVELGRIDEEYIDDLLQRIGMDPKTFYKSLGTLGGGNHFMEYGESSDNKGFFTIHCGSRNFGVKVFNYWDKISRADKISKEELRRITDLAKLQTTDKRQWKELINKATEEYKSRHCNGYLYDNNLKGYLSDMVICQAYASFNHIIIADKVADILLNLDNIKVDDRIFTTHNYIDFKDYVIRKGSIASYTGQKMIIPFNMRDGIAICEGKSNPDWNYSAPHGAGRIMSRSAAKSKIKLKDFEESMKGIYTTSVCTNTIDESPMAYKQKDEIVELISDTANILYYIIPKINIKSTDIEE